MDNYFQATAAVAADTRFGPVRVEEPKEGWSRKGKVTPDNGSVMTAKSGGKSVYGASL
ncbi:hypothetical protein K0M31_002073 [Melipona bicolor]|uniref:Uncharacterized protein n=1 Tax=Melipona bicolor TaxID=60889 RepID=A0AA40KY69_9HYME|nr:hypothetical protein K0M31_002073 [Melipona bicolor]